MRYTNLETYAESYSEKKPGRMFNEDSFFYNKDMKLFIVADGISEPSGTGHVASNIVVNSMFFEMKGLYQGLVSQDYSDDSIEHYIKNAYNRVNRGVLSPVARISPFFRNCGTTMSMVFCYNRNAYVSNVGDSPIILLRNGKEFTELSTDDRKGESLSIFLGKEDVEPHMKSIGIIGNDRILLVTDGITDVLPREALYYYMKEESAAEALKSIFLNADKYAQGQKRKYEQEMHSLMPDQIEEKERLERKITRLSDDRTAILVDFKEQNLVGYYIRHPRMIPNIVLRSKNR